MQYTEKKKNKNKTSNQNQTKPTPKLSIHSSVLMLQTWNIVFQYINKECLDSVSAFAEEKQSWLVKENNLNISSVS